jgi:hypothetical protein
MTTLTTHPAQTVTETRDTAPDHVWTILTTGFWALAVALGATLAWVYRHHISVDVVMYLDIAEAYTRGDWNTAINSYWSLMYCWLLALGMVLVEPSAYWEATFVHGVNFVIYLFSVATFQFFWTQLVRFQRERHMASKDGYDALPEWVWWLIGYSLFLFFALTMIGMAGPDILVAGFVYLAVGILVRIRRGSDGYKSYALFGAILALGYMAKVFLFCMGFIFLGMSIFCSTPMRRSIPRAGVALLAFLLTAAPAVTLVSMKMDRLTPGDTGWVGYINHVSSQTIKAEPDTPTDALHFPRLIHESPRIHEFAEPIGGTYPKRLDQAHWNKFRKPAFIPWKQWRAMQLTGRTYYQLIFHQQGALLAAMTMLLLMTGLPRSLDSTRRFACVLIMLGLIAVAAHALIWVEGRYVAPFFMLIWGGLLLMVRIPPGRGAVRVTRAFAGVIALAVAIPIAWTLSDPLATTWAEIRTGREQVRHRHWEIAQALRKTGVEAGDHVAILGAFNPYWARLAEVRVVADTSSSDAALFWAANDATQQSVLRTLAEHDITALIGKSRGFSAQTDQTRWRQLSHTDHFAMIVPDVLREDIEGSERSGNDEAVRAGIR